MNKEEIKKAILEGDAGLHAVVLDSLKSTETHRNYVTTISQNYFDQNIGSEHAKVYGYVDEATKAHGFEKPEGVRTSDYVATIAKQARELQQKVKDLEGNNPDETKKQLASIKELHQKELNQLRDNSAIKIGELSKQIETLQGDRVFNARANEINKVVSSFTINKSFPESLVNRNIESVKAQLLRDATVDDDGKTIWNKPDGTPILDSVNTMVHATLEDILSVELKDLIHTQTAGGGASNTGAGNDNPKNTLVNGKVRLSKQPTTRAEFAQMFSEVARTQGLVRGSDDYNKVMEEAQSFYKFMTLKEY